MLYVVTRPAYNYATWVPHDFLRSIGVSYQTLHWGEANGDLFLHFFGAAAITLLIYAARLPFLNQSAWRAYCSVILLCIGAEIFQYTIGRGAQSSDLLLGISGGFMAYLAINKNK